MSDPSDSQSDRPSRDGGSSRPPRIPQLPRVRVPHWMMRRPATQSVESSAPVSPPATLLGVQDPLLPTSQIPSRTPSPVGGQPSMPLQPSSAPPGRSSAPPARPFRQHTLSSRPTTSSPAIAASSPATVASSPTTGSTTPTSQNASPGTSNDSSNLSGEPTTGNGRIRIALTASGNFGKSKVSGICRSCFQSHPHGSGYTWSRVPRDIQDVYWKEFQKKCYWDTSKYSNDQVYRAYKRKISTRYSDYMSDLREIGRRPGYVTEAIWKEWLDAWNTPAFKKKCEQARKNRRKGKETGPAGATHTSGSISHEETLERLKTHLGRVPEVLELFTYTHTRRHDGASWIDQHSQSVEEEYTRIIAEIESEQNHADHLHAFFQAVGGPNNRNRIYGLGTAGPRYFSSHSASSSGSPGASSSTTSSDPHSHIQSQLDRLQSTVDELVALQQRHGQEEFEGGVRNNTDRLNMGTSSSQMADVQQRFEEFEVQMRDQIGALQNIIVRMQEQIDRFQPPTDQT